MCMHSQTSMVGGDVAVVSGLSQATSGQLSQLSKDGVVLFML